MNRTAAFFISGTAFLYIGVASLFAQESHWQKFNRVLDKFDTFDQDTTFLAKPATRWALSLQTKLVKSEITTRGEDKSGADFDYQMESKKAESFSLCANYRCISATFTINPAHQSDVEWDFDLYGDAFGGEIIYHKAQSFSGHAGDEDDDDAADMGAVRQRYLFINSYYVLNHKQFSFPAAFYNQTIQKKSCGSLIFGMNYYNGTLSIDNSEDQAISGHGIRRILTRYGGVCAGYAHNWVPQRRWILHLSVLPTLICWRRNYIDYEDTGKEKIPKRPLDLFLLTRFAASYSWSRYFAGFNIVYTLSSLGTKDEIRLQNEEAKTRMFVGVRF